MNAGMLLVAGVLVTGIYAAALTQYSGVVVAAEYLTWLLGLVILVSAAVMAGKALL